MEKGEITEALARLHGGEADALDELVPLLYEQLRAVARLQMRRERDDHTLDTAALVHEAYLRLREEDGLPGSDRAAFVAAAGQTMRRILVDHARARKRLKRGGGSQPIPLDEVEELLTDRQADEILALEDALERLARIDERAVRVVVHRFFGGCSLAESASLLGVSQKTVQRSWTMARAWLRREIARDLGAELASPVR